MLDANQFRGSSFIKIGLKKPTLRAKIKSLPKLQEYFTALKREIDTARAAGLEPRGVAMVEGATAGAKNPVGATHALFIPVPATKKDGRQIINDPVIRACRFLDDTKRRLCGPFSKARPSGIFDGVFVIRETLVDEYEEEIAAAMSALRLEYLPDVETGYEESITRAETAPLLDGGLGPLFDRHDYEDRETFLSRFSISMFETKLGVPANIAENAAEEIKQGLRAEFLALIDHARGILQPGEDGKLRRFHESSLEKIRAFCAAFDSNNLFSDTELAAVVAQARASMEGVNAEAVKSDAAFRGQVTQRFDAIRASLDPLVTTAAGRRFNLAED